VLKGAQAKIKDTTVKEEKRESEITNDVGGSERGKGRWWFSSAAL